MAQWAGSRSDLFPDALCEKMGTFHSNVEPHSLSHTKRVIETVFRRPFDQVFEEFDAVPIGVGAIAQVVSASLPPKFHLELCFLGVSGQVTSQPTTTLIPGTKKIFQ